MGSDKHLHLISPSSAFYRTGSLPVLRYTPTEFSLERVRSVSVVGLCDVSALLWLVSYFLDSYCCLFVSLTVLFYLS